jgi:fumarate hydratase, class II
MSASSYRTERDSMGELKVPAEALWGAQTQRAVDNFPISGLTMPRAFIRALALIKQAAAYANVQLGLLDRPLADAIGEAAAEVARGSHDRHFPIDVFQTGSGTSTNMNANEVIAHLAARKGSAVHANDHVNMGQSSNDVIPTAIHVSAAMLLQEQLLPALAELALAIKNKEAQLGDVVIPTAYADSGLRTRQARPG